MGLVKKSTKAKMTYKHSSTGLIFERTRGGSPVRISGNTYPYRSTLREAGFAWSEEAKQWEGEASDLAGLKVPEAYRIMPGLEIVIKTKIGGGTKIVSL